MRIGLLASLMVLALSGCTPRAVSVLATSTEDSRINVVTALPPMGLTGRSVTLVATQGDKSAGEATPIDAAQSVLELTETDSGRSIAITLGTSIVLHLSSQRSTGYTWILDEVDNEILVPDGEPQYTATNDLVGAEESVMWRFKSVGTGETTLKLIYARPFEKEQLPLKSFELSVKVGNP